MAASFIGLTVEIQLISGETISGVISNVDPIGGLSVYNPDNHSNYNINRNQIRDLQLIQQQPPPPQQPQSQSQQQPTSSYSSNSHSNSFATHSDPAILSLSSSQGQNQNQNQIQVTPSSLSAPSTSHQSIPHPHPPTSNQIKQTNDPVSNQNQSQIAKVEKPKKVQEEKNKSKKIGNGKNQQQSANQSNAKGKSKAKNGNNTSNGNPTYPNGTDGGFEEDFDFSAGLNNFDKKAIWEEIRISDQSDKSTLLVSHNRISQSRDQGSSSPSPHPFHSTKQLTKDGRNGQTKLAPNENVLSPEPDEEEVTDDREVEELLEKVKEGGLNLNGREREESFEKEGLQEEEEDEDEDESEEFMEALSSPSPAFASSIKRNGSSSSKKTTGMLEIPNSTLTLPEPQKLPQPNFSERPRPSSSTSQNLNGNLEATTTPTSTQSLLSEIQSLKEKLILLETLSSISLDLNPKLKCANAEKGSQVYDCRLNGFKFSLACFFDQHQSRGGSPSLERLRYLPSILEDRGRGRGNGNGNGEGESQEEILKKLPGHYSKEFGLRPENAGVFIGRLRDALKS